MKHFPKDNADNESGTVQIPVGKYLNYLRNNPWFVSTILLFIVLILVIVFNSLSATSGGNGEINAEDAANKLVSFINAQGNGEAELISSEREGALYKVIVSFQGQEIPTYVTLDGAFLVAQPIPLSGEGNLLPPADNEQVEEEPETIEIKTENSPTLGSISANVKIIEFSDYQCPFCERHFKETHPEIKKEYIDTGKVQLFFRDLPLDFHEHAQKAAEAARCFRDQQEDIGYWKMHDKLFENQQSLGVDNYKKWAKELGANGASYDSCIDTGKYESLVKEDASYASSVGVQGTPGFIIFAEKTKADINELIDMQVIQQGSYLIRYVESKDGKYAGVRLSGALPYSMFKQAFDALS